MRICGSTSPCLHLFIEIIAVLISSLVSSIINAAITNLLLTKLSLDVVFNPMLRFPASCVECILSMFPFDCGWNAVVLIYRMFNAFSNCVTNSDNKFDP